VAFNCPYQVYSTPLYFLRSTRDAIVSNDVAGLAMTKRRCEQHPPRCVLIGNHMGESWLPCTDRSPSSIPDYAGISCLNGETLGELSAFVCHQRQSSLSGGMCSYLCQSRKVTPVTLPEPFPQNEHQNFPPQCRPPSAEVKQTNDRHSAVTWNLNSNYRTLGCCFLPVPRSVLLYCR
jgi:hypothetical protein